MDFNDINDPKGYYILNFNSDKIEYDFFENNITPIHIN